MAKVFIRFATDKANILRLNSIIQGHLAWNVCHYDPAVVLYFVLDRSNDEIIGNLMDFINHLRDLGVYIQK
ncbi:hypothetical protein HZP44_10485 [Elizabethkingia anophelis]|uniref:hypothetical protein n=1 Tax=Elizabethkingia anophelis TaxID=1117645 RepID=UPI0021A8D931|nr:hypothetical protein [Elizabethkingia anophelis]MCT4205277.1 hypothetical protein [Elizabethkingia anophelis]MCT4208791.1 hypothetical protein [Elizabethkingia anophelis]